VPHRAQVARTCRKSANIIRLHDSRGESMI
jgi:hypothetical protein